MDLPQGFETWLAFAKYCESKVPDTAVFFELRTFSPLGTEPKIEQFRISDIKAKAFDEIMSLKLSLNEIDALDRRVRASDYTKPPRYEDILQLLLALAVKN